MTVDDFLGIPHRDGGYELAGASCYGLVYIVYKYLLDIELPRYDGHVITARHVKGIQKSGIWHRVYEPDFFDVCVWPFPRKTYHTGLLVQKSPPRVLHSGSKTYGSTIQHPREITDAVPVWYRYYRFMK